MLNDVEKERLKTKFGNLAVRLVMVSKLVAEYTAEQDKINSEISDLLSTYIDGKKEVKEDENK